MAESKEELKSLLMKLKEQREKTDLKVDILRLQNHWDGDCSHEIKRHFLLGR